MKYGAILFDLLTGLLDSWSLWDEIAGSVEAGRRWRAKYLKLTYGCGAYRAYETLVAEAADAVGLDRTCAARLEAEWQRLAPWPEVQSVLAGLRRTHRLGVVTNCSERLGRIAAERAGVPFDVIVTAERAGAYKPDPRPYLLAMAKLAAAGPSSRLSFMPPDQILFVAGSGYDLFGTAQVGLDTYWHNRVGLLAPHGAPAPLVERASLLDLPAFVSRGRA